MIISRNLHKKSSEVFIKAKSTPASLSLKGKETKHTTVKWSNIAGKELDRQTETTQFSTLGTLRLDDHYEYEFSVLRMSVLADIIHWETFSCHTHPLCCLIIQTRDKRLKNVNNYSMSARWRRDDRCDIIILYLTSTSGIIVLLKTPTNYGQIFPNLFCENKLMRTVTDICRPWYNRSYTMMAKPMKTLWMHYAMIEFVKKGNTPYQGQNTSLALCNVKRFANLVKTYGERRRKKNTRNTSHH